MGAVASREEEIRAALQRVLESKYFAQAGSLSSLLRYLVEESLAGRGATVKELTIGCEVFARGAAFDPKTDGIVRVQASRLRGKLRDYYAAEGCAERIVISVPAGGYAAEFLPTNGKNVPKRKAAPRWLLWAVAAVALSAALTLLAGIWKPRPERIQSVTVLPFRNLTGDSEQNFLADGLTDGLITDLGKVPGLRVTPRTTSMSLAGVKKPLSAIARDLKVDAFVEGSMTRAGGNIRVNVNLVDARGGERNLWSRTLEHQERDFAGLQEIMNRQVAAQIYPESEVASTPGKKPPNPEAYAAYLKGRHLAGQGTEAGIRKAITLYEKATELDQQMALPRSALAHAYVWLSDFFMSPSDALPLAKRSASEAVAIDRSLADGYAAMGATALFNDRDPQAAETHLRHALKLNPNSIEALTYFSWLRGSMGRFDEAVASARQSVQLDPLAPAAYVRLQWLLLLAGRYEEVEEVGQTALELFPNMPRAQLWTGASIALRGDQQRAETHFAKAAQIDQFPMIPLFVGLTRALNGDKKGARAELAKAQKIAQRRYICAYEVGSLYSALGEMDEAYRWMERGLGEKCICFTWLMTEPWMKSLRADPRFPALAAKVGLWNKPRSF